MRLFFSYRLILSLPSPPSFSRPQMSSSADSWALVFLSVKIVWTLVFVAQALLFELPSRQRHFTLFNKVRAHARDADQPVSLSDLNSRL
jgi:hypothetical protein